jgi:hypothetical protein
MDILLLVVECDGYPPAQEEAHGGVVVRVAEALHERAARHLVVVRGY